MSSPAAAERYERQAGDWAARRQLLMLQVDVLMRAAEEAGDQERHLRALADLARAQTLRPMVPLAAVLPRTAGGREQQTAAAERQAAG